MSNESKSFISNAWLAGNYDRQRQEANIGSYARNLTLCVAFSEEAKAIAFMDALITYCPPFAGALWLYDTAPDAEAQERPALQSAMDKVLYPARRLAFADDEAALRNHALRHAETDWVMYADVDVRFTGDPFAAMQQDIGTLGVVGYALPLMDENDYVWAFGPKLYFEDDGTEVWVSQGNTHAPAHRNDFFARMPRFDSGTFRGEEPMQITGIQSHACVFHKDTLRQTGGWRMAGEAGAIELALRLRKAGLQLGCSASLVTRCPQKPTEISVNDAKTLEKCTGFRLAGVEYNTTIPLPYYSAKPGKTPRIGLVIDREGWAFHHIAQQIVRHLPGYTFEILAAGEYDNITQMLGLSRHFDLMHYFWRGLHYMYQGTYASQLAAFGIPLGAVESWIQRTRVTLGIYDHLWLEGGQWEVNAAILGNLITGYTVSSPKLMTIYQNRDVPPPNAQVTDGIDLGLFKPEARNNQSKHQGDAKLRVGWAGNSKFMGHEQDYKGLHTIIRPALALLEQQGIPCELVLADRNNKLIPHERMPAFYQQLDVYACASVAEGTPNPALEAMACGIPVVSTDVGLIDSLFGPRQKAYMVPRTPEAFAAALADLAQNPNLRSALSQENLQQIQAWQWPLVLAPLNRFFQEMLGKY